MYTRIAYPRNKKNAVVCYSGSLMVIGLTGRYCAGKDTVARALASRGYRIIDADSIAHEVLVDRTRRSSGSSAPACAQRTVASTGGPSAGSYSPIRLPVRAWSASSIRPWWQESGSSWRRAPGTWSSTPLFSTGPVCTQSVTRCSLFGRQRSCAWRGPGGGTPFPFGTPGHGSVPRTTCALNLMAPRSILIVCPTGAAREHWSAASHASTGA